MRFFRGIAGGSGTNYGRPDDEIFPDDGPLETPDDAFDHDATLRTAGFRGMAARRAFGARTDEEAFFGSRDLLLEELDGTRVMRLGYPGDADGERTRPGYVRPAAVEQVPDEEVPLTSIGGVFQSVRSFLGLADRTFPWFRRVASRIEGETVAFGRGVRRYPVQAAACAALGAAIALAVISVFEPEEAEAAMPTVAARREPMTPVVEPIVEPLDDSVKMTAVAQGAPR